MSNGTIEVVISALDEEGAIGDLMDGTRSTLNRNKVNCLLAARYDSQRFLENVKSLILYPDIARGVSEAGMETARQFS